MKRFDQAEIDAVYRTMRKRRDVRHFVSKPVPADLLARVLEAAHLAPSVGLMQPWRFVRIQEDDRRRAIHALVEEERAATAQALGERSAEFLRLKVEGVRSCAELLVGALMEDREPHVFGRRTMPEMDLASFACAVQNMWLAARAEGLGMGWVSLFDPNALATLLGMPHGAQPVAILCLGYVEEPYPAPLLETQGWAHRRDLRNLVFLNTWGSHE